jgi:hypothetical protein
MEMKRAWMGAEVFAHLVPSVESAPLEAIVLQDIATQKISFAKTILQRQSATTGSKMVPKLTSTAVGRFACLLGMPVVRPKVVSQTQIVQECTVACISTA